MESNRCLVSPPAHTDAVQDRVLARATDQTPGQLRRAVRRAVNRAEPAAVRRRHEAAKRERGVSFWELPDGMAMVSACLPAGEAVGVYGVLDEYARATGGAGDDRTLSARRADALVDLVCGSAGYLSIGTRTSKTTMSRSERRRLRRHRSRVRIQNESRCPSALCSGSTGNQVSWLATTLRDLVLTRTPTGTFPSCLHPPTAATLITAKRATSQLARGPLMSRTLTPTVAGITAPSTPRGGQSTETTTAP